MDLCESAVCGEAGVVTVVTQVVEGFVGVFDCDFGYLRGGEEGADEGVVEVGAVGVRLVGGKDEELGDAGAGRKSGKGERGCWWEVKGLGF